MCPKYATLATEHTPLAWLLWWEPSSFVAATTVVAAGACLLPSRMLRTRSLIGVGFLWLTQAPGLRNDPLIRAAIVGLWLTAAVLILLPAWTQANHKRPTVAAWLLAPTLAIAYVAWLIPQEVPLAIPRPETRLTLFDNIWVALVALSISGLGLGSLLGAAALRVRDATVSRRLALSGAVLLSLGGMAACHRALLSSWWFNCAHHAILAVQLRDQLWLAAILFATTLLWQARPADAAAATRASAVLMGVLLTAGASTLSRLDRSLHLLDMEQAMARPTCASAGCWQVDDHAFRYHRGESTFPAFPNLMGRIDVTYVHEVPRP